MNDFSRFFIDRPIFAMVLSIIIFSLGLIAIPILPSGEYPEVCCFFTSSQNRWRR
jgi:multidrug efflux pump